MTRKIESEKRRGELPVISRRDLCFKYIPATVVGLTAVAALAGCKYGPKDILDAGGAGIALIAREDEEAAKRVEAIFKRHGWALVDVANQLAESGCSLSFVQDERSEYGGEGEDVTGYAIALNKEPPHLSGDFTDNGVRYAWQTDLVKKGDYVLIDTTDLDGNDYPDLVAWVTTITDACSDEPSWTLIPLVER
jgi:hypothetical protein